MRQDLKGALGANACAHHKTYPFGYYKEEGQYLIGKSSAQMRTCGQCQKQGFI